MAHRPFTPRQQRENARFLAALRRTGNARLACRELRVNRSTYTKRRAKCAAFATQWDMTLAAAHAAFHLAGGVRMPAAGKGAGQGAVIATPGSIRGKQTSLDRHDARASRDDEGLKTKGSVLRGPEGLRTKGGEPTIVRQANGKLQLRLAPSGRMTKAAEQAFFSALSASANVRLAAAAAGFAHSSFYKRRDRHAPFAREMRLSLKIGWERLEGAMLAAGLPESHEDDAWRTAHDFPPIPPLTPDQALQLLCLHDKSVNQSWEKPHRKKRRGEPWDTYTERLRAMWRAEQGREAEEEALRRAARWEAAGEWRYEDEPGPPPELPPLEQVSGWSKAKHNPDKAMFGGHRIDDWKKRKKAGGEPAG